MKNKEEIPDWTTKYLPKKLEKYLKQWGNQDIYKIYKNTVCIKDDKGYVIVGHRIEQNVDGSISQSKDW